MKGSMRNKSPSTENNTTKSYLFFFFQTYTDSCVVLPLHIPDTAVMTNLEQERGQRLARDGQVSRAKEKVTTTNNNNRIIKQTSLYSCRGPQW